MASILLPWINSSVLLADSSVPSHLGRHDFKQLYWSNSSMAVNHSLVILLPVIQAQRSGRMSLNYMQTEEQEGTSPYTHLKLIRRKSSILANNSRWHGGVVDQLGMSWGRAVIFIFLWRTERSAWPVVRGFPIQSPLGPKMMTAFLLGLKRSHGNQIK